MAKQELQLRPLQVETMEAVREALRKGNRKVLLYGPTGFGKTEMAIAFMQAADKLSNRSAMILDRIVLCNQTSARLDKYNIPHGVMQSGHWRYRPHERIQVCSAQTIEKRGDFPGLRLLIVDECHQQRKMTTEFINNNEKVIVIGLSASPFTEGLGDTYDTVVSAVTTQQLVDQGFLAPLRVFIAKQIDMKDAKTIAGEWSDGAAAERGKKITGDVVAEWEKKTFEVFGGPRKTIVFCADAAHGADLAEKFAAAGFNFIPISYKSDDKFKADAIADFAKPDTQIHGLIACDILTKGFDVADVMIGVSARPFTKSFSSHVQQMGRVMRAHEGKEFALWLDHSGNYLRFRDDWEEVYAAGVQELSSAKEVAHKEPTEKEFEAGKCPKCGALWPRESDTCSSCGHTRLRRSMIELVAGEMEELKGSAKSRDEKQKWYSELIGMQNERGYASGWSAHKYREKFGVWPRMLNEVATPVSLEVRNWVKSRQIAFAKGGAR